MAWIELHQSLWTHRKTLMLAALLGIDDTYAAAHMARFWCWALDNAPKGDLTGLPAKVIAYGAGWRGDPEAFVDAAVSAGFLDRREGRLEIHDWDDYAGRLIDRREADRERARRRRMMQRTSDVRRMSAGQPSDASTTSVGTQPNPTIPNPTVPNQSSIDTPVRDREMGVLPPQYIRAREANAAAAGPTPPDSGTARPAERGTEHPAHGTARAEKHPDEERVVQAYQKATGNVATERDRRLIREALAEIAESGHSVDQLCALIQEEAEDHRGRRIRTFGYFRPAIDRLLAGEYDSCDEEAYPNDMPRILAERRARAEAEAAAARSPPDTP